MARLIAAEQARAGLRHADVSPNVTEMNQGEDSLKQARSCWFVRPCVLATSDANLYSPGVWFADAMTSFSGVTFVLFCFVFMFMLRLKPRPFVRTSFDVRALR